MKQILFDSEDDMKSLFPQAIRATIGGRDVFEMRDDEGFPEGWYVSLHYPSQGYKCENKYEEYIPIRVKVRPMLFSERLNAYVRKCSGSIEGITFREKLKEILGTA